MWIVPLISFISATTLAALEPPPGTTLVASVEGGGVQVYGCAPDRTGVYAWGLIGPVATLYDASGAKFGTHAKGPTWTADDGSEIVANPNSVSHVARADAVPEVLLKVTSSSGTGILSGVRYVQRLDTAGGLANPGGCDVEHVGTRQAVHYGATYRFFK